MATVRNSDVDEVTITFHVEDMPAVDVSKRMLQRNRGAPKGVRALTVRGTTDADQEAAVFEPRRGEFMPPSAVGMRSEARSTRCRSTSGRSGFSRDQ
jgi:hypothetical protein